MGEAQKDINSQEIFMLDEHSNSQRLDDMPPLGTKPKKKKLSKQLSTCEMPRDTAWERRRRRFLRQERQKKGVNRETDELTDDDLSELKGCIELGFCFNEESGPRLRTTIPALDLYLAVNRQFATSPISSPASNASAPSLGVSTSTTTPGIGSRSSSFSSSMSDSDSWKICSPGEDPEHVKTKLRHWAQAVACSVRQSDGF